MTQLIDKKAVLEAVKALPAELDAETVQRCIEVLSNQPTVDAVPVEWIEADIEESAFSGYDMHAYEVATMLEEWKEKERKEK